MDAVISAKVDELLKHVLENQPSPELSQGLEALLAKIVETNLRERVDTTSVSEVLVKKKEPVEIGAMQEELQRLRQKLVVLLLEDCFGPSCRMNWNVIRARKDEVAEMVLQKVTEVFIVRQEGQLDGNPWAALQQQVVCLLLNGWFAGPKWRDEIIDKESTNGKAQALLKHGKVGDDDSILNKVLLELNLRPTSRAVQKKGAPEKKDSRARSETFGLTSMGNLKTACPGHLGINRGSVIRLLCANLRLYKPEHHFTSITFNKDTKTLFHIDPRNLGKSVLLGLGNYSRGELWVADDTGLHRTKKIKSKYLKEGMTRHFYKMGQSIKGRKLSTRNCVLEFNPLCLHMTVPWKRGKPKKEKGKNHRVTIGFYVHSSINRASWCQKYKLRLLGFNLPSQQWVKDNMDFNRQRPRLKRSARSFKDLRKRLRTRWEPPAASGSQPEACSVVQEQEPVFSKEAEELEREVVLNACQQGFKQLSLEQRAELTKLVRFVQSEDKVFKLCLPQTDSLEHLIRVVACAIEQQLQSWRNQRKLVRDIRAPAFLVALPTDQKQTETTLRTLQRCLSGCFLLVQDSKTYPENPFITWRRRERGAAFEQEQRVQFCQGVETCRYQTTSPTDVPGPSSEFWTHDEIGDSDKLQYRFAFPGGECRRPRIKEPGGPSDDWIDKYKDQRPFVDAIPRGFNTHAQKYLEKDTHPVVVLCGPEKGEGLLSCQRWQLVVSSSCTRAKCKHILVPCLPVG